MSSCLNGLGRKGAPHREKQVSRKGKQATQRGIKGEWVSGSCSILQIAGLHNTVV